MVSLVFFKFPTTYMPLNLKYDEIGIKVRNFSNNFMSDLSQKLVPSCAAPPVPLKGARTTSECLFHLEQWKFHPSLAKVNEVGREKIQGKALFVDQGIQEFRFTGKYTEKKSYGLYAHTVRSGISGQNFRALEP